MARSNLLMIVGLRNPGSVYQQTRHNMGARIVTALAEKHGLSFKKDRKLKGEIALGTIEGRKVLLHLPLSYMNDSGTPIKKSVDYFQIQWREHLLIVSDDIALPFGVIRLRKQGSSGGHNALKDIERCLRTQEYARLRIGVGQPKQEDLSSYVLGKFQQEEEQKLPELMKHCIQEIHSWINSVRDEENNNDA